MAKIYCMEHGVRLREMPNEEPYEDEFSKAVIGILSNPCRCDSCNRPLDEGDTATYLEFILQHETGDEEDYFSEIQEVYFQGNSRPPGSTTPFLDRPLGSKQPKWWQFWKR